MTARPTIVYDDDCGFCTWSAGYAARRGEFDITGFSELSADQRARLPDDYERCVHLLTDERVYSCGAATEEVLCRIDSPATPLAKAFSKFPGRKHVREPLYRWAADHRDWWGKIVSANPPGRK